MSFPGFSILIFYFPTFSGFQRGLTQNLYGVFYYYSAVPINLISQAFGGGRAQNRVVGTFSGCGQDRGTAQSGGQVQFGVGVSQVSDQDIGPFSSFSRRIGDSTTQYRLNTVCLCERAAISIVVALLRLSGVISRNCLV